LAHKLKTRRNILQTAETRLELRRAMNVPYVPMPKSLVQEFNKCEIKCNKCSKTTEVPRRPFSPPRASKHQPPPPNPNTHPPPPLIMEGGIGGWGWGGIGMQGENRGQENRFARGAAGIVMAAARGHSPGPVGDKSPAGGRVEQSRGAHTVPEVILLRFPFWTRLCRRVSTNRRGQIHSQKGPHACVNGQ
jgi:hypothetical protein